MSILLCFYVLLLQIRLPESSSLPSRIVDGCSHGSAYWWRIIGRPFGRPHNQLWDEDLFVDLLRSKDVLSSDHDHILLTIQKMQLFHSQVLSFHSLWLCFAYLHFTINLNVTTHHTTWLVQMVGHHVRWPLVLLDMPLEWVLSTIPWTHLHGLLFSDM